MSGEAGLSPLAALFLRHLDDINAGRAALGADIQNLLAGVAERAGDEGQSDVSGDAHGVQRTWTVKTLNLPVILRLSWAPDALPKLSLTTEPPKELVEVFPAALMRIPRLPAVQRDALLSGTAGELWRLWQEAVDVVDDFVESGEIARRSAAVAVMQKISERLPRAMRREKFPKTKIQMQAGKTSKSGKSWPCYLQWQLAPDELDRPVACDLSYWPSGGGSAGSDPVLALVLYRGTQILQELDTLVVRFHGKDPVVRDWSDELLDFEGDADAISDLADKIVDESMELYAAVLKKMGLVK